VILEKQVQLKEVSKIEELSNKIDDEEEIYTSWLN
jgi:hypothetical protein